MRGGGQYSGARRALPRAVAAAGYFYGLPRPETVLNIRLVRRTRYPRGADTMGQIALEGLEFFAFHGYYDEEQKIGNKYGVDLHLKTDLHAAGASDKLAETVNYEVLYRVTLEEMQRPARLLEHLAHRILDRLLQEFPQVRRAQVSISKFNPPLGGICHRARVTLVRKRKAAKSLAPG